MRRATILLLATIAAMLLATGVALAATFTGDDNNNEIFGTSNSDTLSGKGGADYITGKGGNDVIYGGDGSDNFETSTTVPNPKQDPANPNDDYLGAGLRGASGDDKIYGQAGDDDLIGNNGNDKPLDDSSPSNTNDWDRAFGGLGDDTINVRDGDLRDEVSCGENTTSDTPTGGDWDTVKIDVDGESAGTIRAADTVHEFDSSNKSNECEKIEAKDRTSGKVFTVTHKDLEKVTGETVAAVEPA